MSCSSASSTSSRQLSFPVCKDCNHNFNDDKHKPLLLPCGHVFCKSCLDDQEDNDRQKCRMCHSDWEHSNVSKLAVVFNLIPPTDDGNQASAEFPVCDVCNEDFNLNSQRPLKLPCGHCFCQSCLEVLRNAGRSICPKCRDDWCKVDMNRLPIVKSLIHPSNEDKDVPPAPSTASGNSGSGMTDEEKITAAGNLYLRSNSQDGKTQSQIFVTDTKNCTHTLRLNLRTATVTQLRTLVAEATGVQAQHQCLLFGTQQLEDGQTLTQCRITANASLRLTCRLRGGHQCVLGLTQYRITANASLRLTCRLRGGH